jgi:rsbT antagonist protein RsbS
MSEETISVIKMRNVLMVTMPSDPDDSTVSALQERTLSAMDQHDVRGLILDISKVETLDSYFARTVSETAKMVALMGGNTVIVGMRPAVAITATQLGLTLGTTRTALSVERALDAAARPEKKKRIA